jgi:hypothetical protein
MEEIPLGVLIIIVVAVEIVDQIASLNAQEHHYGRIILHIELESTNVHAAEDGDRNLDHSTREHAVYLIDCGYD